MGAAGAFVSLQWRGVIASPESETPLVVLALIHYLGAAVFHLTSLYQRDALLERLGLWATALGLGLNAAAWGTRGLIVGYYPLSNLYDTARFFALATAAASLIATFSSGQHLVGALAMPVAVLLVVLGLLYGNEVQDLPPVLVSYWRPIHVTLAMAGYGACTVSFVTGLLYLLKDRVRLEMIAVFALVIPMLTSAFISGGSILSHGVFFVKLLMEGERIPMDPEGREFLRASIPHVGAILRVAFIASAFAVIAFAIYLITAHPVLRAVGHWAARFLLVLQGAGIFVLFLQLQRARDVVALIDPAQRGGDPRAVAAAVRESAGAEGAGERAGDRRALRRFRPHGPHRRLRVEDGAAPGRHPFARDLGSAHLSGGDARFPLADAHGDHRSRVGERILGPVLGMGSQGDVGPHHLALLRHVPAHADHARMEGASQCPAGRARIRRRHVHLSRRELSPPRTALLCRRAWREPTGGVNGARSFRSEDK